MSEFNYKKWLIENKRGPLQEQDNSTLTYQACSICPEGAVADSIPETAWNYMSDISGDPSCYPIVQFVIPTSSIQGNNGWFADENSLQVGGSYGNEYIGDDPEVLAYDGNMMYLQGTNMAENMVCSGSEGQGGGDEENTENTETQTWYGCSVCPEGAVNDLENGNSDISGNIMCLPVTSFEIPSSDLNNIYGSEDVLYSSEYIGDNPEIAAYGDWPYANLYTNSSSVYCSGSGDPGNTGCPDSSQLTDGWIDTNFNAENGVGYNVEEYCMWCDGEIGTFIEDGNSELCPCCDELSDTDTGDTDTGVTEGACKKVTLCPACPSNNNYNPDRSYEIGGNLAQACGTWSINNCMTVDGATPELGQFVLVGSAQQVWMVWNVEEATTDTLQNKQSTGCPELDIQEPQGAPPPLPQTSKPGTGGDKSPQKDKKLTSLDFMDKLMKRKEK